jgi:hypothetical protein
MRALHFTCAVPLLAILIAACTPQLRETTLEPSTVARPVPQSFPCSGYERSAAQKGKSFYRVDPARSLISILVRRGGSLARLGHDHVVASHGVQGCITPEEGSADLYIVLVDLVVDEPALRAETGLDTQPSESDIAGTRANMLEKVLNTQQFPFAHIRVNGLKKMPMGVRLNVAITLHGVTRAFEVPAQMDASQDEMNATGSLELNQSDFGIVPFSILGGAIQVQDRMALNFKIRSRRVGSLSGPSSPWSVH